jgi:endo-1,4-beta-xylanase
MVAFSRLTASLLAVPFSFAAPLEAESSLEERGDFNFFLGPDHPLSRRSNTNYNQDYTTGGTVNFVPSTNSFSVNWNTQQDFVVGVGWNPGSNLPITHNGTFSVNSGLGSLSVYGWTTNPLVEYYVMEENVGISTGGSQKGTVTSDGGTYAIWENTRVNKPSIQGTSTFNQYISIRQSGRTSGTVTLQNHFNAWAAAGMKLGTMNFQVIAVESWSGSGSAQQGVSNTGSGSTGGGSPTTTSSAPGHTGGSGSGCSALWGQCGGQGWTGPNCCSQGTCKESNAWYSQCLN